MQRTARESHSTEMQWNSMDKLGYAVEMHPEAQIRSGAEKTKQKKE